MTATFVTTPANSEPEVLLHASCPVNELPGHMETLDLQVLRLPNGSHELRGSFVPSWGSPHLLRTETFSMPGEIGHDADFHQLCKTARARILKGECLADVCPDLARQLMNDPDAGEVVLTSTTTKDTRMSPTSSKNEVEYRP